MKLKYLKSFEHQITDIIQGVVSSMLCIHPFQWQPAEEVSFSTHQSLCFYNSWCPSQSLDALAVAHQMELLRNYNKNNDFWGVKNNNYEHFKALNCVITCPFNWKGLLPLSLIVDLIIDNGRRKNKICIVWTIQTSVEDLWDQPTIFRS